MLCHVNLKVNREFIFMQACMYGFFCSGATSWYNRSYRGILCNDEAVSVKRCELEQMFQIFQSQNIRSRSNFQFKHYIRHQNFVETFFFLQVMLRRMVYLAIKELANIAEDVIIVTSRLVIRRFYICSLYIGKQMLFRLTL